LKKKKFNCWDLESHCQKEQDPDPDPYKNVTDPEQCSLTDGPGFEGQIPDLTGS
jgi:hypothetical protein